VYSGRGGAAQSGAAGKVLEIPHQRGSNVSLPPAKSLLGAAVAAARLGARELKAGFGSDLTVGTKSHGRDLVTQVDLASERVVLAALAERWPQIGLLAEETGMTRPGAEAMWIVDPLDGTTNFAHGYPVFCVSVACVDREGPLVGVILDPLRDELFTAVRGEGAYLSGRRLAVSEVKTLDAALFTTGWPYFPPERRRLAGQIFTEVMVVAGDARRSGSAALDLAYIAAGRSEAHFELNLSPHDIAAGLLLVREAGGRYEALSQARNSGWPAGLVASNGKGLHDQLVTLVAEPHGLLRQPFSFESVFQAASG
jgi:myo-inositol-1(or 4)-monophosphatase